MANISALMAPLVAIALSINHFIRIINIYMAPETANMSITTLDNLARTT